jgi:hypothetical protein
VHDEPARGRQPDPGAGRRTWPAGVGQQPCPPGDLVDDRRELESFAGQLGQPAPCVVGHRRRGAVVLQDHQTRAVVARLGSGGLFEEQPDAQALAERPGDGAEKRHFRRGEGRLSLGPGEAHLAPRRAAGTEHRAEFVAPAGRGVDRPMPGAAGEVPAGRLTQGGHRYPGPGHAGERDEVSGRQLVVDQPQVGDRIDVLGEPTGGKERRRVDRLPARRRVRHNLPDLAGHLL